MIAIAHRINTQAELAQVPPTCGVEVDLRDHGERIILQHDPFKDGEDFEEYLRHYRHAFLILNIKSERIEAKALELVRRYDVKDYFFLDSSFPMIYQMSSAGQRHIALRFSEYEGLDTLEKMRGRVDWAWIDCFNRLPLGKAEFQRLKEWGYKICLVSPDLVGRPQDIPPYRQAIDQQMLVFDAICVKTHNIVAWQS
ncbi:MAG: hypothetical protein HQL23_04665 [Candidatus Omnitrophica bacterium]|nr:hypothetical protein [Candidatus Omnitrophota bacterium]